MNYYQTDAIILKRENIFEADRIYHLYTEDFGMVKALAGSVRKINAKLAGHLEPFNLVWVELAIKKSGDLFITTALSYKPLLDRSVSTTKITLFSKMADLMLKMLIEPQKDDDLWYFIIDSFAKASLVETGFSDEFFGRFKNGLTELLGFGGNFEKARYYLNDFGVV